MPAARTRPARPARPAAPPLPPFDALDETHRRILRMLDELDRLVGLLTHAGSGDSPAALAARACSFFAGTARAHHDAEELTVFPRLLADASPELLGHVRRLQQDHNWLEEDWLELRPHLEAVAQGYGSNHVEFLRLALREFTALYREHIALEETTIYPEARRRCTADERAA